MKARLIGVRDQFEVTGVMKRPCQRGKWLEFDLTVIRAKGSPDDAAGITMTIPGPAEPKIDYHSPPEFYYDGA